MRCAFILRLWRWCAEIGCLCDLHDLHPHKQSHSLCDYKMGWFAILYDGGGALIEIVTYVCVCVCPLNAFNKQSVSSTKL